MGTAIYVYLLNFLGIHRESALIARPSGRLGNNKIPMHKAYPYGLFQGGG